ncbi:hypothetical protein [Chamaesiphon minutus]|uniref:hypothetical protein n=1 Tax=Chamaesiphon minutus TaxID=1173032 RepID=UPI0002FD4611|nr:hypothetical protein [Chamaesiphon minutus]
MSNDLVPVSLLLAQSLAISRKLIDTKLRGKVVPTAGILQRQLELVAGLIDRQIFLQMLSNRRIVYTETTRKATPSQP